MKIASNNNYFIYILTNKNKTVLYIGVTNNLPLRLSQHAAGSASKFTAKYNCTNLIYYEGYATVELAITREKQLKGQSRLKKEKLINTINPEWKFLNDDIL